LLPPETSVALPGDRRGRIESRAPAHPSTRPRAAADPPDAFALLHADGAAELDLQEVFRRSYDTGPYRREIRYLKCEPTPPLTPAQAAWARERLAAFFGATS
jgi:hypothetical protein